MLSDIKNRDDVYLLVTSFYCEVRKDEVLGPIFNSLINDWKHHFDHLTDFWESQLFMVNTFKGNPLKKHQQVDEQAGGVITELHFGIWLNHWYQTLDKLFSGEKTQLAKNRARNMGTYMYLEIFKARE
ncbi:MAG: group III truncated hemoglobin [Flavobacteriaceae bacterium]|nr:group III truncated hemoglobin [Flavobacteriaceae bacterium]